MKRPAVVLAAGALLLFAAITVFKVRVREDEAGRARTSADELGRAGPCSSALAGARPCSSPPQSAERIREFWEVYREATASRVAGDPSRAAVSYQRALVLNPQHEDALYYLGNMYLELGRFEEAAAAWERLVRVNPNSSRAHARLGDLYFCPEPGAPVDLARAELEYRRALEINQEETGPLLRLGEIQLVRGRLGEALRLLDAVIGANAGSVEAHALKGYVAWRQGDTSAAFVLFAQAVDLARPREPAGLPGEGDTRRGRAPLAARAPCGGFTPPLGGAPADRAELAAHMRGYYEGLLKAF